MKELDFKPSKSGKDFHSNYKLHDKAAYIGESLLTQWGVEFQEFGKDQRFSRVWERGEDKPDLIIKYRNKTAFLDWKSKHKSIWKLNYRAATSYKKWSLKYQIPVIIVFFVFNEFEEFQEKRLARIGIHNYKLLNTLQWDKNKVVQFEDNLPQFTKLSLIEALK